MGGGLKPINTILTTIENDLFVGICCELENGNVTDKNEVRGGVSAFYLWGASIIRVM